MRNGTALLIVVLLAACAPEHAEPQATDPASGDFIGVAYYDRNNDGVADFELHLRGCDDCDWALVDKDFNGRYEMHARWGFSLIRKSVDIPVPLAVELRTGQSPPYGWMD
ncbi:hypothetical protein [Lysobacter sp. Root604]|uniref:hypothetical protein n=1 Tax=Lysobacter sp. Root604 TaxID=1736568 RepID=UPI0012F9DDBB|nr:hypothetical protein [Lysobacter sp. Root604]